MLDIVDVLNRKSVKSLQHILNGISLEDFQTVDLTASLLYKKNIIGHETGMGKTFIASAYMKALHNENKSRKFLMVVKTNQLNETPQKVEQSTGLRVCAVSSAYSSISRHILSEDFIKSDIVIIAAEMLNNTSAFAMLYKHRKLFTGLIVDEAHEFTNVDGCVRAFRIDCMTKHIEYLMLMTATPMTTKLEQFTTLVHYTDRREFWNTESLLRGLKKPQYNFQEDNPGVYIRRTRKDLGIGNNYNTKSLYVEPTPEQEFIQGKDFRIASKGFGAYPQVNKLIEVIKEERPKKGIVYIRHHAVRRFVEENLRQAGIRYACINGLTTMSTRKEISKKFYDNEYDVVLTSVTTSIDLDCDYIFFYEFTSDARQVIGRGERGLIPKTLNIYFLFTLHPREITSFIKNVYERSLIIQEVLGNDYKELIAVGQELMIKYGNLIEEDEDEDGYEDDRG